MSGTVSKEYVTARITREVKILETFEVQGTTKEDAFRRFKSKVRREGPGDPTHKAPIKYGRFKLTGV
jgi:hypothetical protein